MKTKLIRLLYTFETTKNPFLILLVWFNLKSNCIAKFRSGYKYTLTRQRWDEFMGYVYLFHHFPKAELDDNTLTILYKKRELKFSFGSYGFSTILEIFGGEPYKYFFQNTRIKDRQVIDVGAAFGDTAIAFLIEGAKQVFGYEAFPGYERLAEENIKLNNYQNVCEIYNCAIGANSGIIKINESLSDMFGSGVSPAKVGMEVKMMSLSDVVQRHNIKDAILKIDVEGYEYEILLNTPVDVLRNFTDLVIEYHYGFERLEKFLKEAGYRVTYDPPHHVYMSHLKDESARNMSVGNIYATLCE